MWKLLEDLVLSRKLSIYPNLD